MTVLNGPVQLSVPSYKAGEQVKRIAPAYNKKKDSDRMAY